MVSKHGEVGHRCQAVLALTCSSLQEDQDLLAFLADELRLLAKAPEVIAIDNVLGEHLTTFGLCQSDLERELTCETICEQLAAPGEDVQRLVQALQQGLGLQEALASPPQEEEVRPAGSCEVCSRIMPLTDHHLFPRQVHKKYLKRGLMQEADRTRILICCRQCHNTIHRLFDNDTLAGSLNTLQALQQEPQMQSWIAFACKQKARAVAGLRVCR